MICPKCKSDKVWFEYWQEGCYVAKCYACGDVFRTFKTLDKVNEYLEEHKDE